MATVAAHISSTPAVSPTISLGVSPHHAVVSGPDGGHSAAYCFLTEKDKTVSEAYDLYYKGSLIDSLSRTCNDMATRDTSVAIAASAAYGDAITFAQLYQRFSHVGRGFAEIGLHPSERALIFMAPNTAKPLEWLLSCYGLWSHGMQVVVANTGEQMADAVRETRVRVVITTTDGAAIAAKALSANSIADAHIVVCGGAASVENVKVTTFADLEANGMNRHVDSSMTMPRPEPGQYAIIAYSSHTPGRGIVLTHGNLNAAITVTTPRLISLADGKALQTSVVEPLSHLTPFVLASACLIVGGTIALGSEGIQQFAPTLVACTNAHYASVIDALGVAGARTILQYTSPEEELLVNADAQGGSMVTGASSAYWYSPMAVSGVGLMPLSNATTAMLLPGTEMRLRHIGNVDDKGGRLTEILLRGPCVSKGYYIHDKVLEELDRSILCDGWMPTGDVAEISFAGEMRIVGRLTAIANT